jgi:hypothetical protein
MRNWMAIPVLLAFSLYLEGATAATGATKRLFRGSFVGSPSLCAIAFDSSDITVIPPDNTTDDNPRAASVTFPKPCTGTVIGTFFSVTQTPVEGSFISIDMRATCIAGGGFPRHCSVGEQVLANQAHTIFESHVNADLKANSITMIWPQLREGVWEFAVLPGGDGTATLSSRTFTATALEDN